MLGACGQSDERSARPPRKRLLCHQLCTLQAVYHVFLNHDWFGHIFHHDVLHFVPPDDHCGSTKVCHLFHTGLHVHHGCIFRAQRS